MHLASSKYLIICARTAADRHQITLKRFRAQQDIYNIIEKGTLGWDTHIGTREIKHKGKNSRYNSSINHLAKSSKIRKQRFQCVPQNGSRHITQRCVHKP
jgi:hypothetical protein